MRSPGCSHASGTDSRARSHRAAAVAWSLCLVAGCLTLAPLAAAEAEPEIGLRWALSAMETGSTAPSAIKADTQLAAGDRLKFLVEPLTPCSVYLVLQDSSEDVHVLYRKSAQAKEEGGRRTYIPPDGQWFEVDKQAGMETFFLLASAEPLADLEALLDAHEAAPDKKQSASKIVAEIRRLHKAHRDFARPIEKPTMIGGQTRGTNASSIDRLAVEVSAERFYEKTITIEH
jgi:hypothetical protein